MQRAVDLYSSGGAGLGSGGLGSDGLEQLGEALARRPEVVAFDDDLLTAILDHSPHGIIVCDAAGQFVMHNRAANRIWAGNASAASVAQWGAYRAFHPDGSAYAPHDWAMARCLRAGEVVPAEEVRFQRFDDTFGILLGSCAPIRDADGEITGALSVFADITELKRIEQAERSARAEAEQLLALADAVNRAPDLDAIHAAALDALCAALRVQRAAILVVGGDGVMRFKASLGLSSTYQAAVEGHSLWALDDPEPSAIVVPDVRTAPDLAAHLAVIEREGIRALAFVPLTVDRQLIGKFMAYAADVHEFTAHDLRVARAIASHVARAVARKQSEDALREANAKKDAFLAMLSHELRNPLAAMRSSLDVLTAAPIGSAAAARAQRIVDRQTTHLTRMVDDLLDVTRIERGKVELQRTRLDLGVLVRRTLEDLRPTLDLAGLTLDVMLAPEPLWADADATRIAQMVGNVILNASKFTPRGGHVEVVLRGKGELAELRIRDSGIGFAPELGGHLLEPFTQIAASLDRSRGGLGLGLALVKGLVELHGGTVTATSPGPDRGATFTLELPLATAPAPVAAPAPAPAVAPLHVLVIDDNQDAADMVSEALALDGHDVARAYGGPEGLALALARRPDVVLCDIGLPLMDGYEVAARLRADATTAGTYLVALTGYTLPDDLRRATEAGFDAHLAKPASVRAIRALLASRVGMPRG